jgi:hypothetical protein
LDSFARKRNTFVVVANWYTKKRIKTSLERIRFFYSKKNILERSENSIYVARPDGKNAVGHKL